ncbi:MAG: hypothetical protein HGJ94_17225 [Desulfosarcina sp.]|nr:hypothetical protein [Desulfosarcina sp.]MBC2742117.1 hypothetical protein [Desulfosarcina sp.]MBC2765030.1 hypothetical protein [Desulfosarcina sp.]
MEHPNEMKVNGVQYIRKDTISGVWRIVILPRGWVFVGKYTEDGEYGTLNQASIVRKWGTARSLAQIAEDGPMDPTVLDECPTVRFNTCKVIATIDCVAEMWMDRDEER